MDNGQCDAERNFFFEQMTHTRIHSILIFFLYFQQFMTNSRFGNQVALLSDQMHII